MKTDILVIGAGPVGLFTVFEAGILGLKCTLIDNLDKPGGQCAEIYPKKPIYDIPGYPSILAGDLVDNLMEQIKPFKPGFTLGETAADIEKTADNQFIVTTKQGTKHQAPVVAIAGGLGVFIPRKPPISNLKDFEVTLRYMNSADRDTQAIREFRKQRILKADVYRKENFRDTFPLLNNILKIYE